MSKPKTENHSKTSPAIDTQSPSDILAILLDNQKAALESCESALPQIEQASELLARSLMAGGKIGYVGAGSSGIAAIGDGIELPGTYGIAHDCIRLLFAGGHENLLLFAPGPEDSHNAAVADVRKSGLMAADCAICVSASGTTPYTVKAMQLLKESGVTVIAIANNRNTPLLNQSDIAICLSTPPEIVAGSTRMAAGTAQKVALNMMSTLMAIHLGHVYDGYMVNLQPDNKKLRLRAEKIIEKISGCSSAQAKSFLVQAGDDVKVAILLGTGVSSAHQARLLLGQHDADLRSILKTLQQDLVL